MLNEPRRIAQLTVMSCIVDCSIIDTHVIATSIAYYIDSGGMPLRHNESLEVEILLLEARDSLN